MLTYFVKKYLYIYEVLSKKEKMECMNRESSIA